MPEFFFSTSIKLIYRGMFCGQVSEIYVVLGATAYSNMQ